MKFPILEKWASDGDYFTTPLLNHKIFYKDIGSKNAKSKNTLLLMHGFPESSFSYHKIIEGMKKIFDRIVLFDMIGYGLSDKPTEKYSYSLLDQANSALLIWQHLGIKGGHILAHDMGDSVTTELAARHVQNLLPAWFSDGFQSFTFTNGSMVLGLAKLRITQKILLSKYGKSLSKIFSYNLFEQQVKSAHGNNNLSKEDLELLWENILFNDGRTKTYLTIKYLNDRKQFENTRWLPALKKLNLPIHLCWGEEDQVARVAMAHYLKKEICPKATLTLMPGVGHFCQLGSPEKWIESISEFYNKI